MFFYNLKNGILPTRKHDVDAGMDLYSTEDVVIKGMMITERGDWRRCTHQFNCEIAVQIPSGCVGLILDKSGRGDKLIKVFGGVIDSGYNGPIKIRVLNLGWEDWEVKRGIAIAQLLVVDVDLSPPQWTNKLITSERGESGFGSIDLTR